MPADKPIIFSAPMVRALLEGKKTQTRRPLKPQLGNIAQAFEFLPSVWRFFGHDGVRCHQSFRPPYTKGDRLYVRETHAIVPSSAYRMSEGVEQIIDPDDKDRACVFREGWERSAPRWRPSIHMPRWASRLTLIVTDVRIQRLQEITEDEALAEGIQRGGSAGWTVEKNDGWNAGGTTPRAAFALLWNSLYADKPWTGDPWVSAVTFSIHRGNIDQIGSDHTP